MMRRDHAAKTSWPNIDLGRIEGDDFYQRMRAVRAASKVAAAHAHVLANADFVYARNLDMLACAFWAMRRARFELPVVYECADLHWRMGRKDPIGIAMRRLEGRLLRRCELFIASSSAVVERYYDVHHPGVAKPLVVENRLEADPERPARPSVGAPRPNRPLTIGWFGDLSCERSLKMLLGLADRFGGRLQVSIRGQAPEEVRPEFERRVSLNANVGFGGDYQTAEELAEIHSEVDLVWTSDLSRDPFASSLLVPQTVYEAGYWGAPVIAIEGTASDDWLAERSAGFTVAEPVEESLSHLLERLLNDPEPIAAARRALLDADVSQFVQLNNAMTDVVAQALGRRDARAIEQPSEEVAGEADAPAAPSGAYS